MKRPLLALACSLALSGAALAQQDVGQPPGQGTSQAPGGTFLERVKNAFKALGEKARPTVDRAAEKGGELKDKAAEAGSTLKDRASAATDSAKAKTGGDTQSMGSSPAASSPAQPPAPQKP